MDLRKIKIIMHADLVIDLRLSQPMRASRAAFVFKIKFVL